jgi:hypothetical protein
MKVSFKMEALLALADVFNEANPALDVIAIKNAARTTCTFIVMLRADFSTLDNSNCSRAKLKKKSWLSYGNACVGLIANLYVARGGAGCCLLFALGRCGGQRAEPLALSRTSLPVRNFFSSGKPVCAIGTLVLGVPISRPFEHRVPICGSVVDS